MHYLSETFAVLKRLVENELHQNQMMPSRVAADKIVPIGESLPGRRNRDEQNAGFQFNPSTHLVWSEITSDLSLRGDKRTFYPTAVLNSKLECFSDSADTAWALFA